MKQKQTKVLPPIKGNTGSSGNHKLEDDPSRDKVTRPRDDRQFDPDIGVGVMADRERV
jgi:hypothetical protein